MERLFHEDEEGKVTVAEHRPASPLNFLSSVLAGQLTGESYAFPWDEVERGDGFKEDVL